MSARFYSMYLFLCIFLLSAAAALAATVYRSTGPDGQVVYSDKPPADGKVQKTLNFANLPATPMPDSVLKYRQELEKSMKNRLSGSAAPPAGQTVLFSAVWCGYCTRAKAHLAEKKIPYQEYDIDTPDGMRALLATGGGKSVPVLLYNGQRVQGYSRQAYDALFGAAR